MARTKFCRYRITPKRLVLHLKKEPEKDGVLRDCLSFPPHRFGLLLSRMAYAAVAGGYRSGAQSISPFADQPCYADAGRGGLHCPMDEGSRAASPIPAGAGKYGASVLFSFHADAI